MSLNDIDSVALIGAGKMGLALAKGWLSGGLAADRLWLVDPNPQPATEDFSRVNQVALFKALGDMTPDVLILAVKPQVIVPVMESLQGNIAPTTLVLSIAAGISLAQLGTALGTARVVRTMPNTPAQVGKGVTGAVAGSGVTADDRATAESLLKAAGDVVWFDDEKMIDAVTSVSGSGPAYVFHLVEALAKAGEEQGLSAEQAMKLARQTIVGAAGLLESDPASATTLRENVTSPNGTTAAALKVLMSPTDGFAPLVSRAVAAARQRSEELGRGQ